MERETQISAIVSRSTRDLLERHVRATGVKKGRLVEQALRHHLQALQELPTDVIVPSTLVVTKASGSAIVTAVSRGTATPALRRLLRG